MKQKYYDYDERLKFKPGFNLWRENFEEAPYSGQVKMLISIMRYETEHYSPRFNTVMTKNTLSMPSTPGANCDYYKFSPKGRENDILPAIIYYHGGGFNCPVSKMMLNNSCFFADYLKCHVFLLEYDLAPEVSSDVIVNECYEMYSYIIENATMLGVDSERITVYGDSAGGALAAGTTLLARDKKIKLPKLLMLIYPVGDFDLSEEKYPSMGLEYAEWNKEANQHMWNILFKKGRGDFANYIAPLQHGCYTNMPLSYIEVCEFDTLKDQGVALHKSFSSAGNQSELIEIPRTYHGYDGNIDNAFALENIVRRCERIIDSLHSLN